MGYNRNNVVAIMQGWIGKNEADGSFKTIINEYNSIIPLPYNYRLQYTDAWCAGTVSAAYHKAGYSDIFPSECSCGRMIERAKTMGIWQESDSYVPLAGDCIMYDWDDNGVGDNQGYPEHVGMVEKVTGTTISVIEGNNSDMVRRRTIKVNGKYIRGFVCPKFDEDTVKKPITEIAEEVIKGEWGNGDERKKALEDAGYDYAEVQKEVNKLLNDEPTTQPSIIAPQTTTVEEKKIWDYLMATIKNEFGVAGLMGNLFAESGLYANNLQNTANAKLNMSDAQYTNAVDTQSYTNFVKDSCGYGLAQWTYWSRKEALLTFATSKNASIGNLDMQLEYLVKELKGYKSVYKVLTNATSVGEASNAVLINYEAPATKDSADTQQKRTNYGMTYYNKYATKESDSTSPRKSVKASHGADKFSKTIAGDYKVTPSALYIRDGGGTNYKVLGSLPKGTIVNNYGYYSLDANKTKWLYVAVTINNTDYVGFCSSADGYLIKQ